ncbi:hypothetical protein ACE103_09075 [Bradyrhizobium sp. ma5]|uniref:hypothetical protein n=1 Tax=Bradyrhizobium sp. ma5 TaxID=3344828 RepID=UPI0035D4380A
MRVWQKNKLTYGWARKGSRPLAAHDQRTQSAHLFGTVRAELATGAALVLHFRNSEAMQLHPNEIESKVWHLVRQNWPSNHVFKSYGDIVNHCCYA